MPSRTTPALGHLAAILPLAVVHHLVRTFAGWRDGFLMAGSWQPDQCNANFWEECVMTRNATGSKPPDNLTSQDRVMPKVNKVTAEDITASLKAGFSDFLARPIMSGFFGLFYAVFGILLVWTLVGLGKIWMIIPAVVAFPLVAPFAAAGSGPSLQKG